MITDISSKLYDLRVRSNTTQIKLGEAIGYSGGYISMVENLRLLPSRKALLRIANHYGMTYDELIEGTDYEYQAVD